MYDIMETIHKGGNKFFTWEELTNEKCCFNVF